MAQSAQTYYEDESLYGDYQFITLKEVVDEMMIETTDTDSYLVSTPRSKILIEAKNGVRELNRAVKKTISALEITVNPKLFFALPQDYVDWVAVSVVGEDFKLYPLNINTQMLTAVGVLQDNNYDLLFNNDGELAMADSSNIYNKQFNKYEFAQNAISTGRAFLDTSKLAAFGEFNIDTERGVISFDSTMVDKEVVLHYISDGMQMQDLKDTDVKIHKDLKELLIEYIYMKCVSRRRSVPMNEKDRAKGSYKSLLHKAKIDRAQFNIDEIVRAHRTASKVI